MTLDLKTLLSGREFTRELSYFFEVDCLLQFGVGKPGTTMVEVTGTAQNTLGLYQLQLQIQLVVSFPCDRCLQESEQAFSFAASHEFSLENLEEKEESTWIDADGVLDLDAVAISDIALSLPSKFLCKEDCKGLCTFCGANFNSTQCDCDTTEIDPRLAALKQLLK